MDIAGILSGIKDKVLDAKHIELLKHAYDLQNQNIEQLKSNNEALREKAQLLEENAALLNRENEALKATIRTLESRPTALPQTDELSEDEVNILKLLTTYGAELNSQVVAGELRLPPTKAEYYLDRLFMADYLQMREQWDEGRRYSLAQKGREYLVRNGLV